MIPSSKFLAPRAQYSPIARASSATKPFPSSRKALRSRGRDFARLSAFSMALAAQGMREIHAQGSDAHHAAATFAVVSGPRHFAAVGLQRGEAGGPRRAAAEEFFLLEQPACFVS